MPDRRGSRRVGLAAAVAALAMLAGEGLAQTAATGPSGLPLPRFVSLKADRVNVRVGPGQDFDISWIFVKPGLPVEIVQEYDNWRRVRDSDGAEGWVFHSLLSGRRTALVAPWAGAEVLPLRKAAAPGAAIEAYLEPGVQATIERCAGGWCRISGTRFGGWIPQDRLWGVYPDEEVR